MVNNTQESTIPIRYKDIALARQKKYYQKHKEKIKEKAKEKYHNMTKEQKEIHVQKQKEWLEKQSPEKKKQLKACMREYAKNIYHNHVVYVKSKIMYEIK